MPRIYFTVTNDLSYDQRMIRICTSLADNGYEVILVGRKMKNSGKLASRPFKQHRLWCLFDKGPFFYASFNIQLFFYLLFKKMDAVCAIDLDTILPCFFVSAIRRKKRIYDAHELFCEMKEVKSRPVVYKIWKFIERKTVPHFTFGYTVNQPIANEFKRMYGSEYEVIRSVAVFEEIKKEPKDEKFIIYQGAVNEGRSFETLIPAMRWVNIPLRIYGDGNFMQQAKALVKETQLEDKVFFMGLEIPESLKDHTRKATIGITLFEKDALSNYYSLANRFFDYLHAGIPQLCMDYPVYREINNNFNIAVLIDDLSAGKIAKEINGLLEDEDKYSLLEENCYAAAKQLNWQQEELRLLAFYKKIFG